MARDIYVAKSGSNNNPGTEAQPYLTISKAAQVAVAGDIILVKAGVYRETVTPTNHGSAAKPIIFKAFGTDEVTISATEEVGNWTVYSGGIYKASANMPLNTKNMLYYNGVAMDLARWPNNSDNNSYSINATPVLAGSASHVEASNVLDIDWSGGYIWYLGAHSGASWTRPITDASSSRVDFTAVDITKWPFNPHNPTVFRNGNRGRFYLFNALGALDYEREWYYNANTIYFKAPGGANPNNANIEYAAREKTINITKNHIHFDGINAFGGKVYVAGSFAVVKNGNFKHCLETIDDLYNTSAQIGDGAIDIVRDNATIENNVIEYGSANGIIVKGYSGGKNTVIRNNIIRHFNTIGNHSSLIRSTADNVLVENNTAYGTGRDGLYINAYNCVVAYNDVYEVMKINNDGGVFYTVGNENQKNTEIHHNWFHDSKGPAYADGRCAGIYLDNDSKGYDVHHNVVWNITWAGIQTNWDVWDNEIYNNTIWNVSDAMGAWLPVRDGVQKTIKRTKIYNNYSSIKEFLGTDLQNNIINANSPFANVDAADFMPKPGAVLIDAGREISGITDGFLGAKPDVGAYEYGGLHWTAGANIIGLCSTTWYEDIDGDGVGDVNKFVEACNKPNGYVSVSGDFCLNDPLKTSPGDCGCGIAEGTCNEIIAFTQNITTIPSINSILVDLTYTVGQSRDLVLVLLDGNGAWVGNSVVTVDAGTGVQRMVINLSNPPTVGPSYRLDAYIRPVGGDFTTNVKSTTVNISVVASGEKDCAGEVDGFALLDDCGVCSGGTTGIEVKNTECGEELIAFTTQYHSIETSMAFDIEVNYVAANQRDVVVLLNAPDGTWLGNAIKTVEAGSGTIQLTINLNEAPAPGLDYKFGATIREKGTGWPGNINYSSQFVELTGVVTDLNTITSEHLTVYPNPTTGELHLNRSQSWELYTSWGVKVKEGSDKEIDITELVSGLYVLRSQTTVLYVVKN